MFSNTSYLSRQRHSQFTIQSLKRKLKMVHLRLETNISKSKIPVGFPERLASLIGKSVDRPSEYTAVTIVTDALLVFAGTQEPSAVGNLLSVGNLGLEENKKISKVLYEFIEKELGVAPKRMYIAYLNESPANVGFNGTTLHEVFG